MILVFDGWVNPKALDFLAACTAVNGIKGARFYDDSFRSCLYGGGKSPPLVALVLNALRHLVVRHQAQSESEKILEACSTPYGIW